jgi:hypothetical protein
MHLSRLSVVDDFVLTREHILNWKSRKMIYAKRVIEHHHKLFGNYIIYLCRGNIVVENVVANKVCVSYPIPEYYYEYAFDLLGSHRIAIRSDIEYQEYCTFKTLDLETGNLVTLSLEPGLDKCVCIDECRLLLYSCSISQSNNPIVCMNYLTNSILWRSTLFSHKDSRNTLLRANIIVGSLLRSVLLGYVVTNRHYIDKRFGSIQRVGQGYPVYCDIYEKLKRHVPKLFSDMKPSLSRSLLFKCTFYFDLWIILQ